MNISILAKSIISEARDNHYPFSTIFAHIITGTLTIIDIEDSKSHVENYRGICPEYVRIVANGNPDNLLAVAEEALINYLVVMSIVL